MGYPINSFPLVLSVKSDGSLDATFRSFEQFAGVSAQRAAKSFEDAGRTADKSFSFDQSRRQVQQLAREIDAFRSKQAAKRTDILGISESLGSLSSQPLQQFFNQMASSERALDQQRAQSHARRVAEIQTEFNAAIGAIRARQSAQTAAFQKAEDEGNRLIALDRQRIADSAAMVAGPQQLAGINYNPAGATAAASAARTQAAALDELARAAERSATATLGATVADRAFAVSAREAANAAGLEATRLEQVAATQTRVAAAMSAAGAKVVASSDLATNSVRNQRFATIQMGQQAQDFAIQIQGGQNAVVALSQQLSQLGFVMAGLGGAAGKFGNFIAGPWGTALFLGLTAVSVLTTGLFAFGNSADKAKKSTLNLTDALKQYTAANIEAEKALKEYSDAQDRARDGADYMIKVNLAGAEAKLKDALATREQLKATLELQDALLRNKSAAQVGAEAGLGGDGVYAGATATQARLNANNAASAKLAQALRDLRIDDAKRDSLAAVDPIRKLNNQYDDMRDKAIAAAAANDKLSKSLNGTLKAIEAQRKIAVDAEQAKSRAGNGQTLADFISPLAGATLTGKFGEKRPGHIHGGIDLAKAAGSAVRAPQVGVVEAVGYSATLGKFVVIDHGGGTKTRYGHLSAIDVAKGDALAQGETLGRVGSTGRSTGPHLHYEVRVNGKLVDPGSGKFPVDDVKVAEAARRAAEKIEAEYQGAMSKVESLTARFDDQPRLVDQSRAAVRDLDDIIAKYSQLKDAASQAIVARAQAARAGAENASAAAIQQQTQDLQDQIAVEKEIAAGRPIEAAFLERKLALLRTIGDITKDPAALAALEKQRKVMAELRQAQLDAKFTTDRTQAGGNQDALRAEIAGRQDIADLIRLQTEYEEAGGKLSDEQLRNLADELALEHQLTRELELQSQKRSIQIQQARELQDTITTFLTDPFKKGSINAFADALNQSRKKALAEKLSIDLFGDLGAKKEDELTRAARPLNEAGGTLKTAGDQLIAAAAALDAAIAKAANDNPTRGQLTTTPTAFGGAGSVQQGNRAPPLPGDENEIVVEGYNIKTRGQSGGVDAPTARIVSSVVPLATRIDTFLGKNQLAIQYLADAVGGKGGRAINSILNTSTFNKMGAQIAESIKGPIGAGLGKAVSGIGYGLAASDLVKAVGLKGSSTGGAIGGAAGMFIGGPLGAFIGGAIGSVIGGLFKKTPQAAVALSTDGTGATLAKGKDSEARLAAAQQTADNIIGSLKQISDAFGSGGLVSGVNLGSIGSRKDRFTFDPSGQNRTNGSGVLDFATEAEAAKAAIKSALERGVIQGIRESTKRLILAGSDFQVQLEKATKLEQAYADLKARLDPVGAALDVVNKKFVELRAIAAEAGSSVDELSKIEQLFHLERAEAMKQGMQDITSTLQSFLDQLRYRGDTGLSLQTRFSRASAAFDPFAAQINAGQAVDQSAFTETAQSLIEIGREMFGSTKKYFYILDQITALTAQAIANAGGTVTPLVTSTAQTAAIADATGTSYTVGANGLPVAINDNAAGGAYAIPGDRVAMWTEGQFVAAFQKAMGGGASGIGADGGMSVKPVVDAIMETNRILKGPVVEAIAEGMQGAFAPVDTGTARLANGSRSAPLLTGVLRGG